MEKSVKAYKALPNNKSVGPDGIAAELSKAGGKALVMLMHTVHMAMTSTLRFPVRWKGGKVVSLWKNKGNPAQCKNSRGLLVSDHLAKGFISMLKDEVEPHYAKHVPSTQFGSVAKGGTEYAHHIVTSCVDYTRLSSLSIFVLFLDLEKAYDTVVREIVFGWPQNLQSDPRECLLGLGLHPQSARWIHDYVFGIGPAFQQWGVDKRATELIKALHANAWFSYGDLSSVVSRATGGRQGCKLGGTIFSTVYVQALLMCKDKVVERGIVLKVKTTKGAAFWQPEQQQMKIPWAAKLTAMTFLMPPSSTTRL